MAYNPKSKIHTIADGITKKRSEKEVQAEILILIHMLNEDPDTEIVMRESFEKVKNNDREALESFLDLHVAKEYQTIYDGNK